MKNFTTNSRIIRSHQTSKLKFFLVTFLLLFSLAVMPGQIKARIIVGISGTTIQLINTTTLLPVTSAALTISSPYTIDYATSVTFNPSNNKYYVILYLNGGYYGHLATVIPTTGVCSYIGMMNTGDYQTSLTFDTNSGNLYLMSQCGYVCEQVSLYRVDINNAALTQIGAPFNRFLPNIIAYNNDDNQIYHWHENGLEKINLSPLGLTPVPHSGAPQGYITGALYIGGGLFFAVSHEYIFPWSPPRAITITSTGFVTVLMENISFATGGFAYYETVLPVELSSFVSSVNKNNVILKWSTFSESNNSGFDVERRDARSETPASQGGQDVWNKIEFVSGHGTTTSPNNYEFTDRNLSSGKYNYRLKQIDFNGNYEYFNLSNEVEIGAPAKFELSQNYPNPFNPTTKISYNLPFDGKVSLTIFDITGKEVMSLINENKSAGYYEAVVNGSNLSSGVYFYRLILEGNGNIFTATKKMMLMK